MKARELRASLSRDKKTKKTKSSTNSIRRLCAEWRSCSSLQLRGQLGRLSRSTLRADGTALCLVRAFPPAHPPAGFVPSDSRPPSWKAFAQISIRCACVECRDVDFEWACTGVGVILQQERPVTTPRLRTQCGSLASSNRYRKSLPFAARVALPGAAIMTRAHAQICRPA